MARTGITTRHCQCTKCSENGSRTCAATCSHRDRYVVRKRMPDGSRPSRWFPTYKKAERYLVDLEGQWREAVVAQAHSEPLSLRPFSEVAASWLATTRLDTEPSSALGYERIIAGHLNPALGDRRVIDITRAEVQALVGAWSADLAPQTVRNRVNVLLPILRSVPAQVGENPSSVSDYGADRTGCGQHLADRSEPLSLSLRHLATPTLYRTHRSGRSSDSATSRSASTRSLSIPRSSHSSSGPVTRTSHVGSPGPRHQVRTKLALTPRLTAVSSATPTASEIVTWMFFAAATESVTPTASVAVITTRAVDPPERLMTLDLDMAVTVHQGSDTTGVPSRPTTLPVLSAADRLAHPAVSSHSARCGLPRPPSIRGGGTHAVLRSSALPRQRSPGLCRWGGAKPPPRSLTCLASGQGPRPSRQRTRHDRCRDS